MTTFAVGELVRIVVNTSTTDQSALSSDGLEAVVVHGLDHHEAHINGAYTGLLLGYVVRSANGAELVCEPHELRKRRPPSTDESESRQAMLDCIERARRGLEVPA